MGNGGTILRLTLARRGREVMNVTWKISEMTFVRRSNSALLLLHPLILVSPQHLPPPLSHSLNRNHSPIRFPPHSAEHSPRLHSQMVPLPRSALTMRLTGKMKGFLPRRLCLDRHLGTCSDSRKLGSQWKRIPHVLDLKNRRSLTSTC